MRVVALSRDLIVASRIVGQATAAGHDAQLVGDLLGLPPPASVHLLFVNWADREPDWAERLNAWRTAVEAGSAPRLVVYGPHTDFEAHAAAKAAGLGPMWARSRLVSALPGLLAGGARAGPAAG